MTDNAGVGRDSRSSTFIMVYEDVWQALLYDPTALVVFMAITRRTHEGNRSWYGKKKTLAAEAGVSVATFERKIKVLEDHGLVRVTRQYRNPETNEISKVKEGRFTEQIQNIYTVSEHTPEWYESIAKSVGVTSQRGGVTAQRGDTSPHEDAGVTSQRGANIDPSHTSQTHTPNREGASAPVADAPSPAPKKTQAHELPENWAPDAHVIKQMQEECPNIDLEAETRKFRDYWPAQPGAKSRKKDWNATWRNWIRNARPSMMSPNSAPSREERLAAWGAPSQTGWATTGDASTRPRTLAERAGLTNQGEIEQ